MSLGPTNHVLNDQQIQHPIPSPAPIAISVSTPSNNPAAFQNLTYRNSTNQNNYNTSRYGGGGGINYIGSGVRGAEWMTRITMALRSGLPSELDWALTALLQLSCQNPQLFQLKRYPDLLSAIVDRIQDAWFFTSLDTSKVSPLVNLNLSDEQDRELQMILEAVLILRNASLDPENGQYLAYDSRCREVIEKGLALPDSIDIFVEFRLYCIEMAESVCFHITPESADTPLFNAILNIVSTSEDRGFIIPALRALSRLLIRDERNIVRELPSKVLNHISSFLLVDDDELISAALDFFYQFTSHSSNVSRIVDDDSNLRGTCTTHLVRLLTHRLEEPEADYIRLPRRTDKPIPVEPPRIPDDILEELLTFDEPDRATHWIRTAYEGHSDGEVTQISLWKAYEAQFEAHARQGRKLLPAVDFIKNVTTAFRDSAAMVVNLPDGQRKFIIKGIRPREYAIAPSVLKKRADDKQKEQLEQNDPKIQRERQAKKEPPPFGITAALVLQNIARSSAGRTVLEPAVQDLMKAMLLNPTIPSYVQDLVDLLTSGNPTSSERH